MLCPNCGTQNIDGAKFCNECGTPMAATPEPQAPEAVQETAASAQQETGSAATMAPEPARAETLAATPAPAPVSYEPNAAQAPGQAFTPAQNTAPAPSPYAGYAPDPNAAPAAGYAQNPAAQAPAAQAPGAPGAPGTAGEYGTAPAKKGMDKKILAIIIGGVVAGIALIIAIVIVGLTLFGNASKPNLDTLVKEDPAKAAEYIGDLEVVKVYSSAYYAPADMVDTLKAANEAFGDGSKKKLSALTEDIKKLSPWAVAIWEENKDVGFDAMKLKDLQGKKDPSRVSYITYRVLDNPTAEDFYKIAQEVTAIDHLSLAGSPTKQGTDIYGRFLIYYGMGNGPDGTTVSMRVDELGGVYEIIVFKYNDDEVKSNFIDQLVEDYDKHLDDHFEDEYTFPKK